VAIPAERRRRVEFRRLGVVLRRLTIRMAVVAVALPVAPAAAPATTAASIVAPLRAWLGRLFCREIAGSPANGIGERFVNRLAGFGIGFAGRSAKALVRQSVLLLRVEIAGTLRDRNMLNVLLRLVMEVIAIAAAAPASPASASRSGFGLFRGSGIARRLGFLVCRRRGEVFGIVLFLERCGHRLRSLRKRLGSLDRVDLFAAIDDEGLRRFHGFVGADRDGDGEALLQAAQVRAL